MAADTSREGKTQPVATNDITLQVLTCEGTALSTTRALSSIQGRFRPPPRRTDSWRRHEGEESAVKVGDCDDVRSRAVSARDDGQENRASCLSPDGISWAVRWAALLPATTTPTLYSPTAGKVSPSPAQERPAHGRSRGQKGPTPLPNPQNPPRAALLLACLLARLLARSLACLLVDALSTVSCLPTHQA